MKKDFDSWNYNKKEINGKENGLFCHERDVWWCSLGVNVGDELDGTGNVYQRPVLVVKRLSNKTCLIVPLTSSKHIHKMRVPIGFVDKESASAIVSQIRVIDTKRLLVKICYIEMGSFDLVRKTIKDML
jgi:mRNA-degrading endonuclease toxin of MazEF toxin-antitoxin module